MTNIRIKNNDIDFKNFSDHFNWIKLNTSDPKYYKIKSNLVDQVYSGLEPIDKKLLTDYLVMLINFIHDKFMIESNLFWEQLLQNNLLDLRALLNMLLPFISDDSVDSKKGTLKKLSDLYLAKDSEGQFIYTNSQYNRCIRMVDDYGNVTYIERPFCAEYFEHHFKLLLMSIETTANKLHVNWIDILPMRMDEYPESDLYKATIDKMSKEKYQLLMGYIDPNPGLSCSDIYNTIANHLFYQIEKQKWLIFDLPIKNKLVSLLSYLEEQINLKPVWDKKLWSHNTQADRNKFNSEWSKLKSSEEFFDKICIFYIYLQFATDHRNRIKLEKQKLLISKEELKLKNEEDIIIDEKSLHDARRGIQNVPIDEIYLFFVDQLGMYRKSWYYYVSKIQKKNEIDSVDIDVPGYKGKIFITPKNFYNFAKSFVHYTDKNENFLGYPRYWQSLTRENVAEIVDHRLFGPVVTDEADNRWFNISSYIRKAYGLGLSPDTTFQINIEMEKCIKKHLINVIFESLIFHGLLSKFSPRKEITDTDLIDSRTRIKDENKRKDEQKSQMKKIIFSKENKKAYGKHAYYYITGQSYDELSPLKDKKYTPKDCPECIQIKEDDGTITYAKPYFDCLTSDQGWTLTYAMNWISQINFYHHYCNNRVIYVTGATGVGKSTEIPKLLFYCTYMIDYKVDGKVICTIPRISPVLSTAENVSKNMGVPILEYNDKYKQKTPTVNYAVQYKHRQRDHMDKGQKSFLRFVTDGTLFEEIKKSPFLTRSIDKKGLLDKDHHKINWVKEYTADNKYDIVIVDEAHEHNTNMDLILTLSRDSAYINNSLKIIIISATMDDDEPIYRRYYRKINDNRAYPLSSFIVHNQLDRANMDRRVDISKPRETTQFKVTDHFLSKKEAGKINIKNFPDYGIEKTIEVLGKTNAGHLLLFMTGRSDIKKCTEEINEKTSTNIICFPYFGELSDEERDFISKINENLPTYTKSKIPNGPDVSPGTYTRAVIIATNAAEASITVSGLAYVVDSGYAKVSVYDPMTQISSLITMRISYTSSKQRRGRVGRTAPGDVYYLYDEEQVRNVKTSYKIADDDIQDNLVDLLKLEPSDYPIITTRNDVNNINILNVIQLKMKDSLYDSYLNLGIYHQIIVKQYMLLELKENENLDDYIKNFYTYYGVGDIADNKSDYYRTIDYLTKNHDDYHYQKKEEFITRCHTGFDSNILEDPAFKLNFYIIHPDENIIKRNLFTGKMIAIKKSESVSAAYYYYVYSINDLLDGDIDVNKIKFKNFDLPKYDAYINNAKSLSLIIVADADLFDPPSILLETETNEIIKNELMRYYEYINNKIYSRNENIILKSSITKNINEAKNITAGKIDALAKFDHLLWYLYSLPHGLELDVLAMCCLFDIDTRFKTWTPPPPIASTKSIAISNANETAKKFFEMGQNPHGDIYFFWKLWKNIRTELYRYNLLDGLKIDDRIKNQFMMLKDQYIRKITITIGEKYLILDYMYKSGKLDTVDEYFDYVKLIKWKEENIVSMYQNQIRSIVKYICDKFVLKTEIIERFIITYLTTVAEVNRNTWIYQYTVEHKLNDDAEPDEFDVIDWVKNKLRMNRIFSTKSNKLDKWNTILETYLRAHVNNLVRNEISYYMHVRTGSLFDIAPWSKFLEAENTLLNNKTKYILYYSAKSTEEKNIYYLTPVKLQWVINLNPIYYYYFIRNSAEFIDSFGPHYPLLDKVKEIVSDIKKLFDQTQLISYINQLDDKNLTKAVMYTMQKKLIF